jgi:hypothetical protein
MKIRVGTPSVLRAEVYGTIVSIAVEYIIFEPPGLPKMKQRF